MWWIKNTLKLRQEEESYDTINYIKDSKANNRDIGTFTFSNNSQKYIRKTY